MLDFANFLHIVCVCILAVRHSNAVSDTAFVHAIENEQEFNSFINNDYGCKATVAFYNSQSLESIF